MGVPISAMVPVTVLNGTDNFVISQGPNAGDNKRIEFASLLALIQTYGQSMSTVQTTNYTNTNNTDDVIPNFNLLLTEGKWEIFFDAGVTAGIGNDISFNYYISYNTNPSIVIYDPTDVALNGSVRALNLHLSESGNCTSMGASLVVPAGSTYIVKVVSYEPTSQSYTVNNRVLKAIKTL